MIRLLIGNESGKPMFKGNAAILFSDIRAFTTISEDHEPEEVVTMLNEYFELWNSAVEKYGGVIEKFIGDAVVAVFFENFDPHYTQNCLQSGIEVMNTLQTFNRERSKQNRFEIKIGIGIDEGEIDLTIVGSQRKKHLLINSSKMKVAEELEAQTRNCSQTHILVSETVKARLEELYDFSPHLLENSTAYELQKS